MRCEAESAESALAYFEAFTDIDVGHIESGEQRIARLTNTAKEIEAKYGDCDLTDDAYYDLRIAKQSYEMCKKYGNDGAIDATNYLAKALAKYK